MQRAAFLLTGLLFVPVGAGLYFAPPGLAAEFGFSPLWLVRVMGALLLAWGAYQWAASSRPDGARVGALVGGNLLTAATLVPAVMGLGAGMPPGLRSALLIFSAALVACALLALLAAPSRPRL